MSEKHIVIPIAIKPSLLTDPDITDHQLIQMLGEVALQEARDQYARETERTA